ncbi:unnamed protein product [Cylicocyclus nassatus]|uniref:Uncharacterized protein n=1 Tax=Cylicocyclus nassatus TaxID=53992 RepID=A0AA36H0V6_CYLNA|nr:unnamed protein product [Cylicocyclus nassatus]
MPARRSKNDEPASASPPAWLKEILQRWDDYFTRFDRIFELVLKMQETQQVLCNSLRDLNARVSALGEGTFNDAAITWVGIDEKESDHATQAFDREAIKEVIEASGDKELLREWNNKKIDVRRYPEIRPKKSMRPRIIKITTSSPQVRDNLLDHMRRARLSLIKRFVHSYARKDYTQEELEIDRNLRKKAGQLNRQEGRLAYVVRDLRIHKLKTPHDFPTDNPFNGGPSQRNMEDNNAYSPRPSLSDGQRIDSR